ncbi:MAG: hypothetical protein AB1705_13345 [Verrucomicrobiota bacterium]
MRTPEINHPYTVPAEAAFSNRTILAIKLCLLFLIVADVALDVRNVAALRPLLQHGVTAAQHHLTFVAATSYVLPFKVVCVLALAMLIRRNEFWFTLPGYLLLFAYQVITSS